MATNTVEFIKKRDAILPELIALEKKYGQQLALSAMRKRVEFVKEENKRLKGIKRLEKELDELRGKLDREKKAVKQ